MGLGGGLLAVQGFELVAGDVVGVPVTLTFAALTAGTSIVADLDHHRSTATTSLGPLTGAISGALRTLSVLSFHLTRTQYDHDRDATHRGITHSALFAVVSGLAVTALCATAWGLWFTLGLLFFALLLALRALPPREKKGVDYVTAGALTVVAYFTLPPDQVGPWLGAAFALGTVVHCAGDALTRYGVPFWAPFSWRLLGFLPRWARFSADGIGDKVTFALSIAATGVLLFLMVPGSGELLASGWRMVEAFAH